MANEVKWHINPKTLKVSRCNAKIKCRFGISSDKHFSAKEDAQDFLDKKMSKNLPSISKKSSNDDGIIRHIHGDISQETKKSIEKLADNPGCSIEVPSKITRINTPDNDKSNIEILDSSISLGFDIEDGIPESFKKSIRI